MLRSRAIDEDVDVAGHIFAERYRRGWSQTELARRSGVNHATISQIEGVKVWPRLATLRKLAAAFEVPVRELLKDEPPTVEVDGKKKKLGRVMPPRRPVEEPDEDHEDVS